MSVCLRLRALVPRCLLRPGAKKKKDGLLVSLFQLEGKRPSPCSPIFFSPRSRFSPSPGARYLHGHRRERSLHARHGCAWILHLTPVPACS